jgi:lysophospholipid acyltransferase (LPLAT)-like uncharacterized protein
LKRRLTHSDAFIGLLAFVATFIVILYMKTLKTRCYFHPDFLNLGTSRFCCAFWHGRQFLLMRSFGHWRGGIMTNMSWAGEIAARVVRRFGYVPIGASSGRRGARALLKMKRVMEQGYFGAFALDGPSGPIYKSKPGILFLAKEMGCPIVPVATSASRAWTLRNTWDRYLLPKPFSECCVAVGRPLWEATVRGKLTPEKVDGILTEWTAETDRRVGRKPEQVGG